MAQNSKWCVGVNASAGVGFRFFSNVSESDKFIVDFRNEHDKPIFTYGGGLFTEWSFIDRMSISFGLHYSTYGDKSELNGLQLSHGLDQPQYDLTNVYEFHHLGLPINLRGVVYEHDKISLFLSVGSDFNFLMMQTSRSELKSSTESQKQYITNEYHRENFNFNVFAPTLNVSFGVDVPFGQSKLRIEPFYKMNLRTVAPDTGFHTYHFKGGINFAYLYNF